LKREAPKHGDAGEAEFLVAYDATIYERPSLAVDVVLLGIANDELVVLFVRRSEHPHRDRAALPGGFLKLDESLDATAARVLRDKTSLQGVFLEQLYTFGAVERDPRTRVVSVAYYALVDAAGFERAAATGAIVGRVIPRRDGAVAIVDAAGKPIVLAFDHADIVKTAIARVRGKLDYAPIGYELLPEYFTLSQLQRVHEIVAGRTFNKDSFRRRMLASPHLKATGKSESDVDHRPATLYRYVE
jgi:8-oxo-dGTP diphosphatase